jgi:hypothetical protein
MRIRINLNAETNADPQHWFEHRWSFLCLPHVSLSKLWVAGVTMCTGTVQVH